MGTILLMATISILNIVCFFIGAKVGQAVNKDKDIELPNINPIKKMNEYKEEKEYKKSKKQMSIMFENINNYDGTSLGQKDID